MAQSWIKMRVCLGTHPKVVTLASRLGVTRSHVIGALFLAWSIADQHADADGRVDMPGAALDELTGTPGLAAALKEVGWLVIEGPNSLCFPDYQEHNGTTGKCRADAQRRQQKSRDRSRGSHKVVTTKRNRPVTRGEGEKKREEEASPSTPHPSTTDNGPEEAAPGTAPRSARPSGRARKTDALFDAIAQVTGSDPHVTGSHIGKLRAKLATASPPYTPEDLREFARRFHEFCPWAAKDQRVYATLGELEKNIGKLRADKTGGGTGRPGRVDPRPGKYAGFDGPGVDSAPAHRPEAKGSS